MRQKINSLLEDSRRSETNFVQEKKKWCQTVLDLNDARQAQEIAVTVSQSVQREAHAKIAGVVSRCLEAVFEEPYEFKIEFVKRRGRTDAVLTFLKEGQEVDTRDGTEGGALDVASFALRLACLMLSRPHRRKLLLIDEPFKFLSPLSRRARMGEMLLKLAEEMGVQFLIATNLEDLKIGKVIDLSD